MKNISICIFWSLLAFSVNCVAQDNVGFTRDKQAQIFIKLWSDTCAKYFADPAGLRAVAKSFHFQENPPYAKTLLNGQAGTVWDVSIGSLAQNALILLDIGTCQVQAGHATSQLVNDAFEKIMQGIKTSGVSVEKLPVKEIEHNGIKHKSLVYFVSRGGANQGWQFIAITTDAEAKTAQATITISKRARQTN